MKPPYRMCIPASDVIDGRLGDGVEEMLGMQTGEHFLATPFFI
jgi:hypothetical protein